MGPGAAPDLVDLGADLVLRIALLRSLPRLRRDPAPEAGLGGIRGLPAGDRGACRHGVSVNPNGDAAAAALGAFNIALAGCAAVHACILFRPGRARPAPAAARRRNQEAVQEASVRMERRSDARRLVQANPALARELRIGRPDLPRQYDDGGLVDINRVPGYVLAAALGLTQQEVTNLIAARDKLGEFSTADELRDHAELPPGRVDELRDLMIFS